MHQLVDFIEQYRPGFVDEIQPADEIDIELLEDKTGVLPGAYRRFLGSMGRSMGGLELSEAYFGIRGIASTYRVMPWLKRERYVCIAGDTGLDDWYYFMDRLRPLGADDCMIVRMPLEESFPTDQNHPEYVGLEEFLYFAAFRELRVPQLGHRLRFERSYFDQRPLPSSAEAVCALAEANGFTRLPPVERCAMYDRGDAAVALYQHPIDPTFSFTLGCDDTDELRRLTGAFEALTGLTGRQTA